MHRQWYSCSHGGLHANGYWDGIGDEEEVFVDDNLLWAMQTNVSVACKVKKNGKKVK